MLASNVFGLLVYLVLLPFAASAHLDRLDVHHRHDSVVKQERNSTMSFTKRQSSSSAKFTWYEVGLGACGQTNVPSDSIVALDSELYDSGSHCFETITISYGGKTAQAAIMDRCPGCLNGGLDLSASLFQFFSDGDLGSPPLYGEWWYGSGGGASSTSTTDSASTTATSVYTPPSPTSSMTSEASPPASTSSTGSSSMISQPQPSSGSGSGSNSASLSSASATSSATVLNLFNQALVGIGGLAVAGARA